MRRDWVLVAVAVTVSGLLLTVGRGSYQGQSWVDVTVVPADATGLACVGQVGDFSCAFGSDGGAVAVARPLRPFVTTAGQLVLLPGLFEEKAVASWLAHPKSPEERVRVRCESHRVADAETMSIRFGDTAPFGVRALTVADIGACSVY
jgi:hypothetical protein